MNTLGCRLDDILKHCEFNESDHDIIVHELSKSSAIQLDQFGSELLIDGLVNPASTRPLTSLSFNLKDKESRLIVKGDSLVWQTTEPAPLQIKLE